MIDVKQTIQELEMLKGYHESIIAESKSVKEIRVNQGCLVAINHAITLIEEQEERIAIMMEGKGLV